jgi:hypothetical protein
MVTLEPADTDDNYVGTLRPTPAYWEHRPTLQTLTLGIADLQDPSPERIVAAFSEAMTVIRAGGLELRTRAGMPVSVGWIMVGDYAPAAVPPAVRGEMPIIVHVRVANATISERLSNER